MIKRIFLYGALLIFLFIGCSFYYITFTTPGLKLAINYFTSHQLPGKIKIDKVRGYLLGTIELDGITYTQNQTTIRIKNADLSWSLKKTNNTYTAHLEPLLLSDVTVNTHDLPAIFINYINVEGNYQISGEHRLNTTLKMVTISKDKKTLESKATAKGTLNQLIIESNLNASLFNGEVTGQAELKLGKQTAWEAELRATNINPGSVWHYWPGKINMHINSSGKSVNDVTNSKTTITNLSGSFRDHKLSGSGSFDTTGKQYTINDLNLNLGDGYIKANGKLGEKWSLNWDINIPDVYSLLPNASGTLNSKGTAISDSKSPSHPIIKTIINLSNIDFDDSDIKNLAANLDINTNPKGFRKIDITGNQINIGKFYADSISVAVREANTISNIGIDYQNNRTQIISTLEGNRSGQQWTGKVASLNITSPLISNWKLKQQTPLSFSPNSLSVKDLTLQSGKQVISLNGDYDKPTKNWHGKLSTTQFNLRNLNPFLFNNTQIAGRLNLNLTANNSHNSSDFSLQGNIGKSSITYLAGNSFHTLNFTKAKISTTNNKEAITSSLILSTKEKTPIDISLHLPKPKQQLSLFRNDQPINGSLNLNFNSLNLIPTIVPSIKKASGEIHANIKLSGTIGKPSVNGALTVSNGSVSIPKLGINPKNINLRISSDAKKELNIVSSIQSGAGILNIKGITNLHSDNFATELTATGKNVTILNNKTFKIKASPKIKAELVDSNPIEEGKKHNRLNVSGEIYINHALVQPQNLKSVKTIPENFVIINNEKHEKTPLGLKIFYDVKLIFNPDSRVVFKGIDTRVKGAVTVNDTPNQQTTATGQLTTIGGKYKAYGQSIPIKKGKLTFTGGPIVNPGLDITASKEVLYTSQENNFTPATNGQNAPTQNIAAPSITQTIEVGVKVTGSISKPDFELFSNPSILQPTDILSYIALGVQQNQLPQSRNTALIGLLSSIGPGHDATGFKDDLQKALGLNTLNIESVQELNPETNTTIQNTALVIGKNISKRLSVVYNIGLDQPINVLRLKYVLTKHIALQSDNSTFENGADVLFHFWND